MKKKPEAISTYKKALELDQSYYMSSPHLLKTYWKKAQNFPPSPLALRSLSELGFKQAIPSESQYKDVPINKSTYSHYNDDNAVNGWSTQELLQKNSFIRETFN